MAFCERERGQEPRHEVELALCSVDLKRREEPHRRNLIRIDCEGLILGEDSDKDVIELVLDEAAFTARGSIDEAADLGKCDVDPELFDHTALGRASNVLARRRMTTACVRPTEPKVVLRRGSLLHQHRAVTAVEHDRKRKMEQARWLVRHKLRRLTEHRPVRSDKHHRAPPIWLERLVFDLSSFRITAARQAPARDPAECYRRARVEYVR